MHKVVRYGLPNRLSERGHNGRLTQEDRVFYAGASSQLVRQSEERSAALVRAELERPLPKVDDPATTVRVLVPFRAGDPIRTVDVGEVISVPKSLALSLAGIGRVEIV